MSDRSKGEPQSVGRGYAIVHLDPQLIVIDKAHGILSVPGIGPDKADCVAVRVAAEFEGARIVHRLDRDTSGLMVLARDAQTHRNLSMQFEARTVRKRYTALVAGHPVNDEATIDLPIAKDLQRAPRQKIDHEHGRPSITHYEVVQRLDNPVRARLHLRPMTGRSHQLRLHLLSIGHPILGDDLYATDEIRALSARLCLHADQLAFTHPVTSLLLEFESTAPF